MAIPRKTTFVIYHSGPVTHFGSPEATGINDYTAAAVIIPGQSVELVDTAGVLQWRQTAAATGVPETFVAQPKSEHNKGVAALPADTPAYAAGDVVNVVAYSVGTVFSGILLSGQDIAIADRLQIGAGGKFIVATSPLATSNAARFRALDGTGGATASDIYLRMFVTA